VAVHPPGAVTVSVATYEPSAVYVSDGEADVELLPSPKSQLYVDPAGVELFVNVVATPKHSTDDTNEGTGIGLTVKLNVMGAPTQPVRVGVAVTTPVIGVAEPPADPVKGLIFPVPELARPIVEFELDQPIVAPLGVEVND
jgi:hypothetical protein